MKSFKLWLESNILVTGTSQWAGLTSIRFNINGKRYEYGIDGSWLQPSHIFRSYMKYAPGKALNYAKQYGELISPLPEKSPIVQKQLF